MRVHADSRGRRWGRSSLIALALLPALAAAAGGPTEDPAEARWESWRADLDHLYELVEEPHTLRQIFDVKGIDWKAVRGETDARFRDLAKEAKKRRRDDEAADQVAFYGLLHHLVGQLRDSHARLVVDPKIQEAWQAAQPKRLEAGIEFLPGTQDLILVANTFAARGANSPLYQRGVRHERSFLESVNGVPAGEYFEAKTDELWEERGWQSTRTRAGVEALNDLTLGEGESLELVFQTLDASDKVVKRYLASTGKKRDREFKRLKWKQKKLTLHAGECEQAKNARNFRFLALELPELQATSDAQLWYGRLPSGNGYVRYLGVSEKSLGAMREACEALADCPGLVLDMRHNGGGGDSAVQAFDSEEGVWKKPVAILMGPKCMSQGETEIWTLQRMREDRRCEVRFFGSRTAGSSGAKQQFELPSGFASGQFVIRHWHGGRSEIEGVGLEPDVAVEQDIVELSVGIDSCLKAAEDWLARP